MGDFLNDSRHRTRRVLPFAAMLAALCLAACKPDGDSAPATAARASEAEVGTAEIAPLPAPPADEFPVEGPDPAATEPDDLFVGWYFEQGGAGRLQACGQAVPLEVADPTFLRELKAKLGGRPQPVYVRLKVRLAAGAKLDVVEVQQFGVDETPVQDCVLVPPKR